MEITFEQKELMSLRAELKCRRYEAVENIREEKRRLEYIELEIAKIDAMLAGSGKDMIVCD